MFLALAGILSTAFLAGRGTFGSAKSQSNSAGIRPLLLLTTVALVLQVLYLNSVSRPEAKLELAVSHFQGEWNGIDLPLSPAAVQTIGLDRIISRRYMVPRSLSVSAYFNC